MSHFYSIPTVQTARNVESIDWEEIRKIIVIEGTWHQAMNISRRIAHLKLPSVKLRQYKTAFWRYNGLPGSVYNKEENLATIESIYCLTK